jgi:hypothetical protein
VVAVSSLQTGFSVLHIVPSRKYELSYDRNRPVLFSKAGILRVININYVHFVVSNLWKYVNVISGVLGSHPSKYQNFDKAEPNSQFRGKHIHNKLMYVPGVLAPLRLVQW